MSSSSVDVSLSLQLLNILTTSVCSVTGRVIVSKNLGLDRNDSFVSTHFSAHDSQKKKRSVSLSLTSGTPPIQQYSTRHSTQLQSFVVFTGWLCPFLAGASLFMLKMHGKLRFQGACFATFRACSFISSVSIDCHFLVTFSLSHLGTLLRTSVALVCLCEMWQC